MAASVYSGFLVTGPFCCSLCMLISQQGIKTLQTITEQASTQTNTRAPQTVNHSIYMQWHHHYPSAPPSSQHIAPSKGGVVGVGLSRTRGGTIALAGSLSGGRPVARRSGVRRGPGPGWSAAGAPGAGGAGARWRCHRWGPLGGDPVGGAAVARLVAPGGPRSPARRDRLCPVIPCRRCRWCAVLLHTVFFIVMLNLICYTLYTVLFVPPHGRGRPPPYPIRANP